MKEKRNIKKELLQMLAVAAETELDIYIYSWPPRCCSLLYQPERPKYDVNMEPSKCHKDGCC